MHFINVIAGRFVRFTVDGDAVPDLVLHDEHADLFELLAEFLDIV